MCIDIYVHFCEYIYILFYIYIYAKMVPDMDVSVAAVPLPLCGLSFIFGKVFHNYFTALEYGCCGKKEKEREELETVRRERGKKVAIHSRSKNLFGSYSFYLAYRIKYKWDVM